MDAGAAAEWAVDFVALHWADQASADDPEGELIASNIVAKIGAFERLSDGSAASIFERRRRCIQMRYFVVRHADHVQLKNR